jgi:diguanylate cyclase (GGDEF)-like protein
MVAAVVVAFAVPRRRLIAPLVCTLAVAQALALDGDLVAIVAATAAMVVAAVLVVRLRERVEAGQAALRDLALRDPLTGAGNYRLLYSRLTYEIARHRRSGGTFAVLLLDLDGFKEVNDRSGHLAGDRLLRDVAAALEETVRAQDTVARQGGDEFSVLAPETGEDAALVLATRIEDALGAAGVGASVGWALYPEDGRDLEELLERADARQRRVKGRRRAEARRAA